MSDHYSTLGVERSASSEDIKKAYRKLSMEHHPDRNFGNKESEDKFKEISNAYSILSDPDKKQQYDNPDPFGGMFGGFGFPGFPGFNGMQKPQKPDLNSPRDGSVISVETLIPFKIFIFGGSFKIKISYHEGCNYCGGKGFTHGTECDLCNGVGYKQHVERRQGFVSSSTQPCPKCQAKGIMGTDTCSPCKGTGNVNVENRELEINIPANTPLNSRSILNSAGRSGLNGGRRGDIVVTITGIEPINLNKLNSSQIAELRFLSELLDNANKST